MYRFLVKSLCGSRFLCIDVDNSLEFTRLLSLLESKGRIFYYKKAIK